MTTHSIRVLGIAALLAGPAAAQEFGRPEDLELIQRAVDRRALAFADTALRDWRANAHGFVFFLGQIGEGLQEPPRLVKADQLELEVFWRAPNQSKQRIIGWRDRRDLPTDINYHRDHLGIVMNNFPDMIRLGDGDEVRDVPHPVSAIGQEQYEFALVDSLTIRLPTRELRVHEVRFRPVDFRAPRIVGSLFLEIGTADLVRMTFSFTRAAYRDDQLEDITVAVENSLWGGRYWLPLRQEIEIRRRAMWMDFPARGIIRGRFEIDGYQFNTGLDPRLFAGNAEIVAAAQAVRDSFQWNESIDAAIRDVARPAMLQDFDLVRVEAARVAMGHALTGLRQTQVAGASVSEIAHVNRVEGLAVSAGITRRSVDEARELRLRGGLATAAWLPTGSLRFSERHGRRTYALRADRAVRDIGDLEIISGVVNSISAQEFGEDFGDYYLANALTLTVAQAIGSRSQWYLEAAAEWVDTLAVESGWSGGAYARPNSNVATEGHWRIMRLGWRRQSSSFAASRELAGRLEFETGMGSSAWSRAFGELRLQLPAGASRLITRAAGGGVTAQGPAHRAFVLGGRGTLLGEPFRGRGGRFFGWLSTELRIPVPIPEIKLGSFAGTGSKATLAPHVAAGWVGGDHPAFFARPGNGLDVSAGLGLSLFHDLIRLDAGYGVRTRRWGFSFDVAREFWDIL